MRANLATDSLTEKIDTSTSSFPLMQLDSADEAAKARRSAVLLRLAELCQSQGLLHQACKKFTQASYKISRSIMHTACFCFASYLSGSIWPL